MRIRRGVSIVGAATAEHLAFRIQLRMYFEPDNGLIFLAMTVLAIGLVYQ